MKFEISRAENGVILTHESNDEEERQIIVYQDSGLLVDNETETLCFVDFLNVILEKFGPPSDRYSKHRIVVGTEQGDKYIEEDEFDLIPK